MAKAGTIARPKCLQKPRTLRDFNRRHSGANRLPAYHWSGFLHPRTIESDLPLKRQPLTGRQLRAYLSVMEPATIALPHRPG